MVTFEDIFIHCLGSPERLRFYIDDNVDLASYVKEKYQPYIRLAKVFIPNHQNIAEEARGLDHQRVLDILFRKRPDLWQTVMDCSQGMRWLRNQRWNEFFNLFGVE